MPFISVILPAYNASKTISEAIDSILSQSFKDYCNENNSIFLIIMQTHLLMLLTR